MISAGQYAQEHLAFRSAWFCWLEHKYSPQGHSPDDVRKTVEAVFNSVPFETRRRGSMENEVLDWYALGESMQRLVANIAKEPLPTRLCTVLEFFRQLNSYKDFSLEVLDEDAALRMLDDQIAKVDELYREEPVLRKCEYLIQLGRNTEAAELLH